MPWAVRQTGDEWCVYKEGEQKPVGCHASRGQALKQQAALYASEASTAAVTNGGNVTFQVEAPREFEEALVATLQQLSEQMDAVTLRVQRDESLIKQIVGVLGEMANRVDEGREELRSALTAALERPAAEPPVVNVTVPEPVVHVNVPQANVEVTTPAPQVNVTLPPARKQITFTRDELTHEVLSADVVETDG